MTEDNQTISQTALDENVEHISLQRSEAHKVIERAKALDRLQTSPDFKLLIIEGYLEEHALMLVRQKRSPAVLHDPKMEDAINHAINGIGEFHQYMLSVSKTAQMAEKTLEDCDIAEVELDQCVVAN